MRAERTAYREVPSQSKNPTVWVGFLCMGCLTITYFHTGIRTIIGVESFHGPVRDGKGWYQLAMVIRHDLLLAWCAGDSVESARCGSS